MQVMITSFLKAIRPVRLVLPVGNETLVVKQDLLKKRTLRRSMLSVTHGRPFL
jgi:hypothetical protein